jgi:predicted murein hydrolase (TIGR00659 family)
VTAEVSTLWQAFVALPALWIAITGVTYVASLEVRRRTNSHPVANPVLISVVLVVCILQVTRTPFETYFRATSLINVLVGPATVALAIPLYNQIDRLRAMSRSLSVALVVGSIVAIGSAVVIGHLSGASPDLLLALAPKSATMPVAMGVVEKLGGVPSLAAVTVTATGVTGAVLGPWVLDLMRVEDPAVRGFSLGLTSHGVGTAQALRASEMAGGFAALGMGLNAMATTVLVPLVGWLLPQL